MNDVYSFGFHPLLASWFAERFGTPTDVQQQAWRAIAAERHTLIAAPTGSGKTLAALLPCLSRIAAIKGTEEKQTPGVRLLYITPLKALNNDIHHHVQEYAEALAARAEQTGEPWPGLTVGLRTGDMKPSVRAAMLRRPPDVLITTPESFYLLLTSTKGSAILRTVTQVIVDEIHDLADGGRGTHLSVTLERLTALCGASPQRIGVSATQNPIGEVARFLGGWTEAAPRPVDIVESRMDKRISLQVTMPPRRKATADKQEAVWGPLTDHLLKLMEEARTAIVFVNNRRLCERLTLRLNERAGFALASAHHGSVSREQRLAVEEALKSGALRCLVATSSLELGIDVGSIDLVLQIDSPKSAAAGIQRVGRAGHAVGEASRGFIVARSRDQLPECAVLARDISSRTIEPIRIPRLSLDMLCQHIVAMVASGDWTVRGLHAVLARSYAYRELSAEQLESVLEVLSGYYPFVRPLLDWDRASQRLARRSATLMAATMGAGAIPPSSAYPVHHADSRIHLGELDEEYIHESRVGDVFRLGTSTWRIQAIRNDRVYVVEASGGFGEIPFWRGEGQGRSPESSAQVGRLLAELEAQLGTDTPVAAMERLMDAYALDALAAEQLVELVQAQKAAGAVPTDRRIVIELFRDDTKQQHLVIHSWFGKTFNRTWLMALQRQLEQRMPYRFYSHAKDNGIELVFPGAEHAAEEALRLLRGIRAADLEPLLLEAVPGAPMFGAVFRQLAETSLLLARGYQRSPSWQRRLRSEELLREALPYAERFPFIAETMRLCLHEQLDLPGVRRVLEQAERGETEVVVHRGDRPTPLAALFMADYAGTQLYASDTVGQDVQARLNGLDLASAGRVFGQVGYDRQRAEDGTDGSADSAASWSRMGAGGFAGSDALGRGDETGGFAGSDALVRRDETGGFAGSDALVRGDAAGGFPGSDALVRGDETGGFPGSDALGPRDAAGGFPASRLSGSGSKTGGSDSGAMQKADEAGELAGSGPLRSGKGTDDGARISGEGSGLDAASADALYGPTDIFLPFPVPETPEALYWLLKQRGDLAEEELAKACATDAGKAAFNGSADTTAEADGGSPADHSGLKEAGAFPDAGRRSEGQEQARRAEGSNAQEAGAREGGEAPGPERRAEGSEEQGGEAAEGASAGDEAGGRTAGGGQPPAERERLGRMLAELARTGRIREVRVAGGRRWICADEAAAYAALAAEPAQPEPAAQQLIWGRYASGRTAVTAAGLAARYDAPRETARQFLQREAARGKLELAVDAAGEERWLNARAVRRATRQAADALRRETAATPSVRYASRLLEWQGVAGGVRRGGEEGLRQTIAVLQGLFFPLGDWESRIFPLRVPDYRKELLDALCAGGEVVWIGRKGEDEKEGQVAFFLADAVELLRPFLTPPSEPSRHEPLLALLRRKGASFLTALSREYGAAPSELLSDLLELVWEGRVANDQFGPLRLHGASKPSARASSKAGRGSFQSGLGRWYALEPPGEAGPSEADSMLAWIKHTLGAYGLLTRDIAAHCLPWSWDALYRSLKQLELWGTLTRGLWVEGIETLQFASPETVERLRPSAWSDEISATVLPAADPANPYGFSVAWPDSEYAAFARKAGNYLVFQQGEWVLWVENNGRRWVTLPSFAKQATDVDAWTRLLRHVALAILKLSGARKLIVDFWDKTPIQATAAAEPFRALGAEADRASLVLWPSELKGR